jgi:CubicO group peptidase (beta-lactamase class C family)
MKTSLITTLLILVALAAFGQTTAAPPQLEARSLPRAKPEAVGVSSKKLDAVMPELRGLLRESKLPGAIILVARRGKIILFEAAGHADLEGKKPLRKDALLRFYSMTKPLTSVAAMMLVEEGKLDLDAPVARYLPALEKLRVWDEKSGEALASRHQPTVRDLMRHTAGFTYGFFGDTAVDRLYRAGKVLDPADDTEAFLEKMGRLPLLHRPGKTFHYGVATDVLGALIEKVSQQRLGEFFRERIFGPLGMKDTGFHVEENARSRFLANFGPLPGGGLVVIDDPKTSPFLRDPKFHSGGGGLVSTANDYALFCQMLLDEGRGGGKRLLKKKSVAAMLRNQLPSSAIPSNWLGGTAGVGFGLGFAVVLSSPKSPRVVGECSWSGAASTHFWINPRQDLTVLILSQHLPMKDDLSKGLRPLIYEAIKR